jgi:methionyl-tRNA synthetase
MRPGQTMRSLITSALPYINGIKHLGNLIGSMLPADVYARFLRATGEEVLFLCATDDHGTPAELAAEEAGLTVAHYCDLQHALQRETAAGFDLSFDHFGRSSSARNAELTQHFAARLMENGYIEERTIQQIYSSDDKRFLPDRYVIGTCPHCGYAAARGDQCESCTRVLDPTDLVDARSAVSGSARLELRETRHLFLLQSQLAGEVRDWVESRKSQWPPLVTSIALKWLDEGLNDRCITRDLHWGIPVNREGFEGKVFYVWFDAPIEYISATREWADAEPETRDWQSWWRPGRDVSYVQFMAKDNVPFHTVGFPCTVIGSREPWKLVDVIKGFNWLTYYGDKFSTSRRRGVFMDQALKLLPADYWRYYLIANAPEGNDADFTWDTFAGVVNADLADNFGNFVNRVLTFVTSRFDGAVPAGDAPRAALAAAVQSHVAQYTAHLRELRFRKAVNELRHLWSLGNTFVNDAAPWKTLKTDRGRAAADLQTSVNLVRIFAAPIIPRTSEHVFEALQLSQSERAWPDGEIEPELRRLGDGRRISTPGVLFRKVTDEEVAQWRHDFAGAESAL